MRIIFFWLVGFACTLSLPACKNAPPEPIAGADTTSHNVLWKVDTLGTYGSCLLDISAVSPTSVYAVGVTWDESGTRPTYILRWDGSSWTRVQDDSLKWWIGAGIATGVCAISDSEIFVSATSEVGRGVGPMVAYWNGKLWRNITPNIATPLTGLWGRSSSEVYAIGQQGAILRYDGTSWQTYPSPTSLDFQCISANKQGEIYAVACNRFNSFVGSVVVGITKGGSKIEFTRTTGRLFGVGLDASGDLYVGGEGLFQRDPAGLWPEQHIPVSDVTLYGIGCFSRNDVIATGAWGLTMHWNGDSWHSYPALYDRKGTSHFYRATKIGNTYYLVGDTGSRALLASGIMK